MKKNNSDLIKKKLIFVENGTRNTKITEYLRSEKCIKDCPRYTECGPVDLTNCHGSKEEPYNCVSIVKDSAGFFMQSTY